MTTVLGSIETVLDLPKMRESIEDLESQASVPDLWDDQEYAQQITSRLSFVQGEVRKFEALSRRLGDLPILFELAEDEGDEAAVAEALKELEDLEKAIAELEVRTLLARRQRSRRARSSSSSSISFVLQSGLARLRPSPESTTLTNPFG